MSSKSSPTIMNMQSWNPSAKKYMAPKVNDKGGKSINVISTQTNRSVHITLPLMMTWGISDFTDEKTGESDGKFSMSLNFPNSEYATPETQLALTKLKEFEEELLKDAVTNSEIWFGKKQSREIVEYGFFPFLKYPKNKETKAIDFSRPPSIRPKVPKYGPDWKVEIYDTKMNLLFPSASGVSPIDLVPKQSNVASVIACGGIWIGGKGWGLTWKIIQCVVKPQILENVFGKCHIQLSENDIDIIEKQVEKPKVTDLNTSFTEDSDEEYEPVSKAVVEQVSLPVSVPIVEETKPAVVKKIIKKVVPVETEEEKPIVEEYISELAVTSEPVVVESSVTSEPVVIESATVLPKKKIVKKVVAK
jgi:hypothetical protein